jgi:hypothetical protein
MAWNLAILVYPQDSKRTKRFPVYRWLLKRQIIFDTELGKPYMLLKIGKDPVRGINGIEGRGCFKKRMLACNGQDRGQCLSLKGR